MLLCKQSSYQDSGEEQGAYNDVGSFPKDFGYIPFDGNECAEAATTSHSDEQKPRILLMGLRRSGKSSIQKVVFHKMSPNETLFLESTNKIVKDDINNSSFVQFQIWDFPGQFPSFIRAVQWSRGKESNHFLIVFVWLIL